MPLLPPVIRAFLPVSSTMPPSCMTGIKDDDRHTQYDDHHRWRMQKKIMRYPVEETAAKHERIVKEVSRLFRERGFENVSVAEVMKAAGPRTGRCMPISPRRKNCRRPAVAHGQEVSRGRLQRSRTKRAKDRLTDAYLSPWHRIIQATSCTMAARAQEVARSTPERKPHSSRDWRTFFPLRVQTAKKPSFGQRR